MPNEDLNIVLKLRDKATAPLKRVFITAGLSAKRFGNDMARAGRFIKTHWLGITAAIAGVGFALVKIIDTAVKFEDAFAGVRKTVDATEAEFERLSDGLRKMAKEIPVAAVDLAKIQEIAGQLGVTGVKNLEKFTETVAKIAVTTNLTRESAATNFARIANIMQEPLENVDRMGAAIVELGNNFATTEAEISNFAMRIAGASNVVGLSTADILGFGAAFTSVGVRAERGGTAVSKALIMMSTAAVEGGEQLDKFARISGMTADEFAKAFEEDAAGAFAVFIEGLGNAGREGAEILKELELGDQRLIQAFLSVGGASGILTTAIEQANIAFEENTALNEEAAKRFGTTASQIQLFRNNLNDLSISLGQSFLPMLQELLPAMSEFLETLDVEDRILKFQIGFNQLLIAIHMVQIGFNQLRQAALEALSLGGIDTSAITEHILILETAIAASIQRINDNRIKLATDAGEKTKKVDDAEIKSNKKVTAAIIKSDKEKVTSDKKASDEQKKNLKSTGSFLLSTLSSTLTRAATENKSFAVLSKAVSIGEAIMNTSVAVTKALASAPPPFNYALAAAVAAMGAAEIGMIAAQTFHKGGPIQAHDGMSLAGDEVPIIAQTGEGILSRRGMQAIGGTGNLNRLNAGAGGGSNISIVMENVSFRNEDDIEDVMERLSDLLVVKSRSRI